SLLSHWIALSLHSSQRRVICRHCERSEAIQSLLSHWIALSLHSSQRRVLYRHCERSEAIQCLNAFRL
ncbi:MAG: hypothetical protein WCR08_11200, partial [Gammaproteobacteria bacterium]